MTRSLRQSLNVLHTWGGLVAGSLIFFVFFTGSLVVFEQSIDRWMMPDTRTIASGEDVGFEGAFQALQSAHELGPHGVFLYPPTPRRPVYAAHYHDAAGADQHAFISRDGQPIADPGTFGASEFFFPLHYSLHFGAFGMATLGYWLVGLAGMMVLAMVVSGIVVHRRLLRDFFSLRLERARGRALLDVHNISGVMSLPFLVFMAFSGVAIFVYTYMPVNVLASYSNSEDFFHDVLPHVDRNAADMPAERVSLDHIAAQARSIWQGGEVMVLGIHLAGDAHAYVAAYRDTPREIAYRYEQLDFDATDGTLLHQQRLGPAMQTYQFLTGLHIVVADSWAVRWLYFLMGVAGCVVIASGFLVWLEKRAQRTGQRAFRCAQAMAGASTVGLLMATLAMLAANRLLPAGPAARAEFEVGIFFTAWIASLLHAWLQPGLTGLGRQLLAVAALALSLPVLNAITTGDALPLTIARGQWQIAGVDLVMLLTAVTALYAVHGLRRAERRQRATYRTVAA
ncbi:PepSY-associated TM helix domain-containing protein [Algiphilus sp.]|uniref:PepSY-associated TM helix domain-containing protein n=1 Tax=Algiphilus sp. TaxID=1872431 RepID=UPI003B5242F8